MNYGYADGAGFIVACQLREADLSPAMEALSEHANGWLATVDSLCVAGGLSRDEAMRAADAGFRGDNIRAARRYLAGGAQ